MSEKIMTVDSEWLNRRFGVSSTNIIQPHEKEFIRQIESNCMFIDRNIAETNKNYKQIVSYCLIVHENDYFITHRTVKQTEKRLHNKFSLGIGGHVCVADKGHDSTIQAGLLRELCEEVDIQCPFSLNFLGIINDNSSDVNSVHVGICYLVKLNSRLCSIKETEKMNGFWIAQTEIQQYFDKLEGWSKILVNSLDKEQKNGEHHWA